MPLSIGTSTRDVLMHVLSSFQCQTFCGAVRTFLKKKLMRSCFLPQQIFFLMFTIVYTLMAIWLNASDTACELHGGSTDSGILLSQHLYGLQIGRSLIGVTLRFYFYVLFSFTVGKFIKNWVKNQLFFVWFSLFRKCILMIFGWCKKKVHGVGEVLFFRNSNLFYANCIWNGVVMILWSFVDHLGS